MVVNEFERREALDLGKAMVAFHAGSAQIFAKSDQQRVETKIWELSREQGLLAYQRLGLMSAPWDKVWREAIDSTESRLYERTNQIGQSGLTERGIVDMVTRFEAAKKRWEHDRESERRPAS